MKDNSGTLQKMNGETSEKRTEFRDLAKAVLQISTRLYQKVSARTAKQT